ncbi:hypothetical protein MPTK1_6g06050 [Marchantia polymorpha subsp. ruderalis]|uniref:Uncharacterized protein n=2 Tax=Marchantia polymorpha TaxID=3197 RepID=A0AAF6BP24_MARPO|nr:hypothetical protein MARPO_0097s0039 [Marchantia polymorpha]BBN13758.1 hypothetical protein Mp_6g06050 [Marchantia polymorpha subsp. ruderalis]|eukprot:PTQ32554.1 hypothetical protein MARPO_0097s0039 [Marchantia polymorpha]
MLWKAHTPQVPDRICHTTVQWCSLDQARGAFRSPFSMLWIRLCRLLVHVVLRQHIESKEGAIPRAILLGFLSLRKCDYSSSFAYPSLSSRPRFIVSHAQPRGSSFDNCSPAVLLSYSSTLLSKT